MSKQKFIKVEDAVEAIKHRINSFNEQIETYELNEFNSVEEITTMVETFIGILKHDVEDQIEQFIFEIDKKKGSY
jgi:CII-binding regulator of phage lambda lysogenization HflD